MFEILFMVLLSIMVLTMLIVFGAMAFIGVKTLLPEKTSLRRHNKRIKLKDTLSYTERKNLSNLVQTRNEYAKNKEIPKDVIDKLDATIADITEFSGVSQDEISLGNDMLTIIDNLIDLYTVEFTIKERLTNQKIDVIHVDKIVEYVSTSTFNSLSEDFFKTKTQYSKDFMNQYIVKKSKVYVLTAVTAYNLQLVQ